jgi:hypothetical protein
VNATVALDKGRRPCSATARQLNRLLTPYVTRGTIGVGYGWFNSPGPNGTVSVWTRGYESFGHGAALVAYPDEQVIIVVTTNSGEHAPAFP